MWRVLFVDDDPQLLSGLKLSFWSKRREWSVFCSESGVQALELLEQRDFDAVVSDMRMPGMDGEALLGRVRAQYPELLRVVLSGQTERGMATRVVSIAHQFLAKPCDTSWLQERVGVALYHRARMQHPELLKYAGQLADLPVAAPVLEAISGELTKSSPDLDRVSEWVWHDSALAIKLLQVVGSAFFVAPRQGSDIREAVRVLGSENLRCLLEGSSVITEAWELELQELAVSTARLADSMASAFSVAPSAAKTLGLLSTLGARVCAHQNSTLHGEMIRTAEAERLSVSEVQQRELNTNHMLVAGCLAGLWGLDSALTEALFDLAPRQGALECGSDLALVAQLAGALIEEVSCAEPRYFVPPSLTQQRAQALAPLLDGWRREAANLLRRASA